MVPQVLLLFKNLNGKIQRYYSLKTEFWADYFCSEKMDLGKVV